MVPTIIYRIPVHHKDWNYTVCDKSQQEPDGNVQRYRTQPQQQLEPFTSMQSMRAIDIQRNEIKIPRSQKQQSHIHQFAMKETIPVDFRPRKVI